MVLKLSQSLLRFLSGYSLAVLCLSLLFVLTWLSTLEQPEKGLYAVQQRYYSADSWFVSPELDFIPEVKGNSICPPLPSAYLVSVVLTINLILGGLVRIKKNRKKWGVIISHFSMVGLLIAGFVSHHYSREGMMLVFEGDTSDYAQSYTDYSIELAHYKNGIKQEPFVISSEYLMSMSGGDTLAVSIPKLGAELIVSEWLPNASATQNGVNGSLNVVPLELDSQGENNLAACKIKIVRELGAAAPMQEPLQLHASIEESKIRIGEGEEIGIRLIKEIWNMPFDIKLNKSIGEYHPNTNRPRYFESQVTRLDREGLGSGDLYTIRMNEPMRYQGYTLYQARWLGDSERPQSGFAVVQNPADQWPKYCLYLSILGLTAHFGMQLASFLLKRSNRNLKQ